MPMALAIRAIYHDYTIKSQFICHALPGKIKLKEFEVKRTYLTIGYGICDNWEVYGQLGIADVKEKEIWFNKDNGDWYKWLTFDFDYGFAWGWGTRITLLQQDNVKWGVSAQMNFHNSTLEERIPESGNYYRKENSKLETWDMLIAVGPTIDMGGWKLYGGGFYYDLQGDMSWKVSFYDYVAWTGSYDFEADGNVGGFIGAQFALNEKIDITPEFSATADSWAAGAGIALKF